MVFNWWKRWRAERKLRKEHPHALQTEYGRKEMEAITDDLHDGRLPYITSDLSSVRSVKALNPFTEKGRFEFEVSFDIPEREQKVFQILFKITLCCLTRQRHLPVICATKLAAILLMMYLLQRMGMLFLPVRSMQKDV